MREPAFYSSVSLHNLELVPIYKKHLPNPILIHVTPPWWIEELIPDLMVQGNDIRSISGYDFFVFDSEDSGIPMRSHLTLIHDQYWFDISAKHERYEEEFDMVLSTFQFHEPIPHLYEGCSPTLESC